MSYCWKWFRVDVHDIIYSDIYFLAQKSVHILHNFHSQARHDIYHIAAFVDIVGVLVTLLQLKPGSNLLLLSCTRVNFISSRSSNNSCNHLTLCQVLASCECCSITLPTFMLSSTPHWGFSITLISYPGMKASVGYYLHFGLYILVVLGF